MQDTLQDLAWLLAGDEHPPVRDCSEYAEARARMLAAPELTRAYEEARDFNQRHPRLVDVGTLSAEARQRIAFALENEGLQQQSPKPIPGPWSVRHQFAWAALLALLLGGMSVLSSRLIEQKHLAATLHQNPDLSGFHAYAAAMASSRLTLDHRDSRPAELVQWLDQQGSGSFTIPVSLQEQPGLGCKTLKWRNGNVSLICMKMNGDTVHLFVTDVPGVRQQCPHKPEKLILDGREALQWADGEKTFLLITHDPGVTLPEIML